MNLPVSIKGVVFKDGKVILLKNERDEWELPGGRLETDETAEACVVREICEELGLNVKITKIINAWAYKVLRDKSVFIVAYLCEIIGDSELQISHEHKEIGLFSRNELDGINIPDGYKHSVFLVM